MDGGRTYRPSLISDRNEQETGNLVVAYM